MRHRTLAIALAIGLLGSGVGATAVGVGNSPKDTRVAKDNPKAVAPASKPVSKSAANSPKDKPKTAAPVPKEAPIETVQRIIPDSVWGGAYMDGRRYKVMVTDPTIVPGLKVRFSGSMDFVVVKHSLKELDRQMMVVFEARNALKAKGITMHIVDGDEVTNTLHVVIERPVSANARAEILKVVPGAPLTLTSESRSNLTVPVDG